MTYLEFCNLDRGHKLCNRLESPFLLWIPRHRHFSFQKNIFTKTSKSQEIQQILNRNSPSTTKTITAPFTPSFSSSSYSSSSSSSSSSFATSSSPSTSSLVVRNCSSLSPSIPQLSSSSHSPYIFFRRRNELLYASRRLYE
jgi:hypothetical protein